MPTTQEILKAAGSLGQLIAQHDAALKFQSAVTKLQADLEAQRLLNDFNRAMHALAEKEAAGKPIEVNDKHQLEKLQTQVIRHPALRDFQIAQMDYMDLMRQVDEAINGGPAPADAPPPSPLA